MLKNGKFDTKTLILQKNIFKMKAIAVEKRGGGRPVKVYTLSEYLLKEEKSVEKHEFYNGQIIPMPGSKATHNQIGGNVITAINVAVKPLKKFRVLTSDQKIYVEAENIVVYPDVLVICGALQFWNGREDLIVNPLLIVEVLSKSTRKYDKSDKFMLYQNLPSFQEYVLIEPNKVHVESWFKTADDTWNKWTVHELQKNIPLRALNVEIALADIYEHIF
jgi:Uma2 family endonuclease